MENKNLQVPAQTAGGAQGARLATEATPAETEVVLKFVYIDDEVMWPEPNDDGDSLRVGWVRAVTESGHIILLDVSRIRKVYGYGGRLYVLYETEVAERYSRFVAQLPPLAVELDYDVYYEYLHDGDCVCKKWRFSIDTTHERGRFIKKAFGTDAELAYIFAKDAQPVNFSVVPLNIALYATTITGAAVVENPKFRLYGKENVYRGKYIVLVDDLGFYYLYLCRDVDTEKLESLLKRTARDAET
jgi:hypothetical protein